MPRKARSKNKSGVAGAEDRVQAGDVPATPVQAASGSGGGGGGPREPAAASGGGGLPAMPQPVAASGGGGRGFPGSGGQLGVPPVGFGRGGRGATPAHMHAPVAALSPGFVPVPGPGSLPGPPQAVAGRGGHPGRGQYMPVGQGSPPAVQLAPPVGHVGQGIGVPAAAPVPVYTPDVASLAAGVGQLQLQPAMPPVSSKKVQFPARRSLGSLGKKFWVRVNHFHIQLVAEKDLNQYHVDITPQVISRGVNRAVMRQLVEQYAQDLGQRLPVFDGRNSLYTAGLLPFQKQAFQVVLSDEQPAQRPSQQPAPDTGPVRRRTFNVTIKHAARVDLHHLSRFLDGKQADVPQEALQALDIVLRELPSRRYTPIGRSFYSPDLGHEDLGGGLVGWRGFFQSVRPTQSGLSLNLNISATALLQPIDLLEFVDAHLRARSMGNFSKGFSFEQRREVLKTLKGIKVEVTHRGDQRRKYRVNTLTIEATRNLDFELADGRKITVSDYFLETYGYRILYPDLPCLDVGNGKTNYLPMEVCRIISGQRYSARQLGDVARTKLLDMTSRPPHLREREILHTVKENKYGEDRYAREFGMKISEKDIELEARLLDPPTLLYKPATGDSMTQMQVYMGAWNMNNKRFVSGGTVASWACVSFNSGLRISEAESFCQTLAQKCSSLGMRFNPQPALGIQILKPAAADLKTFLARCPGGGTQLGLLIAIFPDYKCDWYGELKRICETEVGVISQCCWTKHVKRRQDQYMANVALKINIKVGGKNTVLRDAMSRSLPTLGKTTTIIFGADVTHPSPGEDSVPSITAVVASQDWPEVATYAGLVSAQAGRVEIIMDLQRMVVDLLRSFYTQTRLKPGVILFYRDGVSEGQFNEVMGSELTAIGQACRSIDQQYRPKITFVVVQKRHHTRFFPAERQPANNKSGNVLAGTVVDNVICHPREFDFYLCSQAGILGTSRPAHYHVLWDDNEFTADSLQTLTNSLCSTYARCTRSVSIVPPAYYAHHLATRARIYMGAGSTSPGQLHARIKPTMFYC